MDRDFYHGRPYTVAFALAAMALFVLLGLAIACHIVWMIGEWRRMRAWVETPAVIDQLEMKSSRRPRARGKRVFVKYTYRFEGQDYPGERVSIFDGTDNLGPFQRDVFRELNRGQAERDPFRCFVNPAEPSEAVLYRDLRWELVLFESVFALAFLGVGAWKLRAIWLARPWRV